MLSVAGRRARPPSPPTKHAAPEATLHYHFRPIFTFRATFVGVTRNTACGGR
jgi:hypothetical protein